MKNVKSHDHYQWQTSLRHDDTGQLFISRISLFTMRTIWLAASGTCRCTSDTVEQLGRFQSKVNYPLLQTRLAMLGLARNEDSCRLFGSLSSAFPSELLMAFDERSGSFSLLKVTGACDRLESEMERSAFVRIFFRLNSD